MNTSISSNLNFYGFSNIVALTRSQVGDKYISYISAKLDNIGEPDLERYQKIREQQGLLANKETDNIATFVYICDKSKNKETLYFQEKPIFWGDELKTLGEKYVPKLMSEENYKKEENIHMKVYTLLASLTRRISNMKFNNEDAGLKNVLERLYKTLNHITSDQRETMELLKCGCLKLDPFQDLASDFNRAVVHTMKQFFK